MNYQNKIALYCKSYSGDVDGVALLVESVKKFNTDRITFYLSIPKEDRTLFYDRLGQHSMGWIQLINDEDITGDKLCQDWKNQQIVKMMFWKLGLAENYVILDSDSYFIKPFGLADFLVNYKTPLDNAVPYTVMHEQKDLFSWTSKHTDILGFDPKKSFGECRQPVMTLFERKGRLYDFGPVPVIWSSRVWQSLEEEYLKPNEITFNDLINTVASEFSWYGEWLLVKKPIELWPIEPMFKVFHYRQQYEEAKQLGYTEEHWADNYLGIVMQSSVGLKGIY
jgi:hypothetical protein